MENSRYKELIYKLNQGTINLEEINELKILWDNISSDGVNVSEDMGFFSVNHMLPDEKYQSLIAQAKKKAFSNTRVRKIKSALAIAASLFLCFGLYKIFHLTANKNGENLSQVAKITVPLHGVNKVKQTKLLDGTIVVMKPGSKIWYESDFKHKERVVRIEGDVYFDVVHKDDQPFIIHSGKLTTTVLGTAFEIKYWPKENISSVVVTRGLVRVTDGVKQLGLLHKNEQLEFNTVKSIVQNKSVDAMPIVQEWTDKDLIFDGETIDQISKLIEYRYGKHFIINSLRIKNIPIKARFTYEDSIEDILNILSTISRSKYEIKNDTITLTSN